MYDLAVKHAGEKSTEYIRDGMVVSLGTGKSAAAMIARVGQLVREGLRITAVATSTPSRRLAEAQGIPLAEIGAVDRIDLAIDGVDEIDPRFDVIKGGGGALYREKINALTADRVIWILAAQKRVETLGAFPLPLEVEPYARAYVERRLQADWPAYTRRTGPDGAPFITDNGNLIFDLQMGRIGNPGATYEALIGIPGVLEVGLFLNMCDCIIVGDADGAEVIDNPFKKRG